jgi:hypothetical protein
MDFCCNERRVAERIHGLFRRLCGRGLVNICESDGFNVYAVVCDEMIRVCVIKPTVLLFLSSLRLRPLLFLFCCIS